MAFLRVGIFLLLFIFIAPQSRAYLGSHMLMVGAWIVAWSPFSFLILLILPVAGFFSFRMVHKAPQWVAPENPMAKYRREEPFEE